MALKILSEPSSQESANEIALGLKTSIESAIAGAQAQVTATSPGHFEISVTSDAFEGKGRVQQQQLVYGAIAHLMKGDPAPVHAVDQLKTLIP